MQIQLDKLTALEQQFVKAAVAEWNDLMFTDDIGHGIPKASLGGVCGSLVKKGIIGVVESPAVSWNQTSRDIGEFQFVGDDGELNYDEAPELV